MRTRLYAKVSAATKTQRGEASRSNLAGDEKFIRVFDDTQKNRERIARISIGGKVWTHAEAFAEARTSDKWFMEEDPPLVRTGIRGEQIL